MRFTTVLFTLLITGTLLACAAGKPKNKNKWVVRATAIEKSACACKDKACAEIQRRVLYQFIKSTKDEPIDKANAKRVTNTVVRTGLCLQKHDPK